MSKKNNFHATGRRKRSVARVNLVKGKGNILINGRSLEDYFGRDSTKMVMMQPLELTNSAWFALPCLVRLSNLGATA